MLFLCGVCVSVGCLCFCAVFLFLWDVFVPVECCFSGVLC